jgi:hypothetical protein
MGSIPSRPLPSHPLPSHPSPLPLRQPLQSHSLLLLLRFHQRCVAITMSIPVALTLSRSLPSSRAIHCQAVHCQAIHHLAIHCCRSCAYINVALPSRQPLLLHCSQAVHCQAIAPSIAKPSVAESFIAVAVEPSIAIALPHHRRVAN